MEISRYYGHATPEGTEALPKRIERYLLFMCGLSIKNPKSLISTIVSVGKIEMKLDWYTQTVVLLELFIFKWLYASFSVYSLLLYFRVRYPFLKCKGGR